MEENGSLVAAPRHWRHPWNADHSFQDVEATTFADSCMVAVHHSVADTLLPLTTEFDDVNWWICGEIFFERAAKLYWGRVHRFSNLHVWNKRNRPYPKERGGWMVSLNRIGEAIRKPMPSVAASRTRPPSLDKHTAVVVTSIAQSTKALRIIGRRCGRSDFTFFIIGDAKTPADFQIDGADYWSVGRQKTLPFRLARALPENHYSRKNIGYLLALQDPNTRFIVETDDDNLPLAEFWRRRQLVHEVDSLTGTGWLNAYRYFTDRNVWPRGFPLQQIAPGTAVKPQPVKASRDCFVQQGLAQHDPDVDAIFRLTQPLPIWFRDRRPIYLEPGLWCPINSQNTTWSVDVAALMYLPTLCPMRETDIWRGLVAQRVLWALGAGVMVHQASVIQDRNIHDLDHDFREESRLYAQVAAVAGALGDLTLAPGRKAIEDNLRRCYEEMVRLEIFPSAELSLLESWCDDLAMIGGPSHHADKPA
ncbi:MAG: DUF288 domain-containing protein [Bauldia sp.]|nr:DUF288 domain-containing protein [Bauldia sp.]